VNKTLQYYRNNAGMLVDKYDNANMDKLYSLFDKYIKKDDVVLDIGFGSGRDLNKISKITNNIFGVDACDKFIINSNKDNLKGRIAKSILPDIDTSKFQFNVGKFDVIISIAVIMHLTFEEIEQTIQNMKNILKQNGKIIISYSLQREAVDDRFFENLTREKITKLFNLHRFVEKEYFYNIDSMNRKIEWITQVYKIGE